MKKNAITPDDFTRIDSDIYGNPRYYVPVYLFDKMPDKLRLSVGLEKYRGKKYGSGYVVQSYNLDSDIAHIVKTLNS